MIVKGQKHSASSFATFNSGHILRTAAKMRFFLLILLFTYFAPLQCFIYDRSNYFFVTRRDNKEAICTEPFKESYSLFPTFDLDKLQIPADVGFKYWDWLGDWQLKNYTNVRINGGNRVLIAGNQPFHFVAREDARTEFAILASNISLWMADYNRPRGAGMLFELDHLNETTKLKDTTLKYCTRNPQRKKAKCTILDYKNGTNFLNDGNHWTRFVIHKERTEVKMFERSYRKYKPVVQCTWTNTNISNPFQPDHHFDVFVKSHQRNAAFSSLRFYPGLSNNKEMKRNYTKRGSGELNVCVRWNYYRSNDPNELMQVKNLASGRVHPPTKTTDGSYTHFQWNNLDAGEYEFTLRFDKRKPWDIDLCPAKHLKSGSKIKRTWESIPKAITKCQIAVGYSGEFSAGPSSPPDPTIKPNWTSAQWEHVCDRLGIGSNDAEVQIKFCNLNGCNFSKCPHLQDDPLYLFDFATENITYRTGIKD